MTRNRNLEAVKQSA